MSVPAEKKADIMFHVTTREYTDAIKVLKSPCFSNLDGMKKKFAEQLEKDIRRMMSPKFKRSDRSITVDGIVLLLECL